MRIEAPSVKAMIDAGFQAWGQVRQGEVAETLNKRTANNGGTQIFEGRASSDGFAKRILSSSIQNFVMQAYVPVTAVA